MEPSPLHRAEETRLPSLADALFDEAATGLCLVDEDGRILRVNDAWLRITGLASEDVVGARLVDVVARDRDAMRRALDLAREGEVMALPRRLVRVGHRETFLDGRVEPVALRDVTAVLVALRDVTSEVTLQIRALEALPNLVWACQADGFCDYLSPQWLDYTGVPFERQAGEGWLEQVHPDDRASAAEAWRRAVATGTRYEADYRLRRSDGVYRWHVARGGPLRDQAGRVQRWLGTTTDIDDRKAAEERIAGLQRATEAFAPALTKADVARVLFGEAVALLGVDTGTVHAVDGDHLDLVFARGVPEAGAERWRRVPLAGGFPGGEDAREGEATFAGSPEEFEARWPALAPFRRDVGAAAWATLPLVVHGVLVGVVGLGWTRPRAFPAVDREFMAALAGQCAQALDRARLYEAERAARERAQAAEEEARGVGALQERLLAVVGHDLRTPLQAVTLGAKVLFLRGGLSEQQAATLARVSSSAARMNGIIRDLLDFTRARHGVAIAVTRAPIDFEATCRRAVLELEEVHPGRAVSFEATGDLAFRGDAERLLQVVSNLVGNALQYGPPGAKVAVAVRGVADAVVLAVHNDGPPIAPEVLATLFEPFRRGAQGDRGEQGGNVGLGLFIVHEIVRAHGGTVEVASSEGEGTTFSVRLPRD